LSNDNKVIISGAKGERENKAMRWELSKAKCSATLIVEIGQRHDTWYNNIEHNSTHHIDNHEDETRHNGTWHNETEHYNTKHNDTDDSMTLKKQDNKHDNHRC
jgi:hypothetical protein